MSRNDREPLVIVVATATDRGGDDRHLRHLPPERRAIKDALQEGQQRGLWRLEPLADASLDDILAAFQEYRDRVAILHFGGHANSYQLLLDSAGGTPAAVGQRGLAEFLGQQRGLQLVFLNGCCTYGHVEILHQACVPMVVATSRAIRDDVACGFAARFYRALGTGASVESAFIESAGEAKALASDDCRTVTREIPPDESGPDISREGWPWETSVAPGAESTLQWSLTQAAGDPTFGLPPVPTGDLPERAEGPYLGLRRFEREHAELFFGRGSDIRALYKWLTAGEDTPPILLLHGQSGVGKSSLLEAGLLPRLEVDYGVRLRRRDSQAGLLRTLATALDAGQGEDLLCAWTRSETKLGRPLLVVLDQVEEVFTQPITVLPAELDDLITALVAIFGERGRRPRGKLILGLRKDYYPELEARLKTARLQRTDHFLQPLSRAGIVEAITAPVRNTRLRDHYRLEMEPPGHGEEPLPEAIADDLRRDRDSPIAPTLQVLLSKMWQVVKDQAEPQLDRNVFREVAKPGTGGFLDGYLGEQLAALATWRPDLAETGLFLDFLAHHTTLLGTARARTERDLGARYAHHQPVLRELIERCKQRRLLAEEAGRTPEAQQARTTRLVHDTLAPLVRRHFEASDAPGQRARRILESRARDWQEGRIGTPLEASDLQTVERGASGMRAATQEERRLLTASLRLLRIRTGARSHPDPMVRALVVLALDEYPTATERTRLARLAADQPIPEAVLRGHNRFSEIPGFSPDGTRVVTAADSGPPRVWQADGVGDPVVLRGHRGRVKSAAFSSDGTRVVTASTDRTARVWQADGAGDPVVLRGQKGFVSSVAFSPDGTRVVTASTDGTARVWQPDGVGDPVVLRGQEGRLLSAAFSPDGTRVVTAADSGPPRVWQADRAGDPVVLRGHRGRVFSTAFSPDGTRVVTASEDGTARVWQPDGVGDPVVLRGHEGRVLSAAFSPDGTRVVTDADSGPPRVWQADGAGDPVVLRGHERRVWSAAFSPDGTRVVTASEDGTARVWQPDGVGDPVVLRGHEGRVLSAAFSPDGTRVVTASEDDTARVWQGDGAGDPVVLRGHEGRVLSAALSPDGTRVVTASEDGTARVWQADGAGDPVVLRGHRGRVFNAAFSPDGTRVVTASIDGPPRVWQADGVGDPVMLRGHERRVSSAAFSPDGTRVVTASIDGTARVWQADGAGDPVALHGHRGRVTSAAFSPDGTRVVTASEDATARVWQADGAGDPVVLRGHRGRVFNAAFSPDGTRVVTASIDGPPRVWQADGVGDPVMLRGHKDFVSSVAISPDGERVVTASHDGTARVWRVGWSSLLNYLRNATTACLTPGQRREFLGESAEEARARYEECERRHGRTPMTVAPRQT